MSTCLTVENVSAHVSVCLLQSQVAEKGRELKELKETLALFVKESEKLEGVSHSFRPLSLQTLPLKTLNRLVPSQFPQSGLCLICL